MARKTRGISLSKTQINKGKTVWRVNIPKSMAGERIRRFFDSEGAAVAWVNDFESRLRRSGTEGVRIGGSTVTAAYRRFEASRGQALRGHNARLFRFWLRHFLKDYGNVMIADISASDLEKFWTRNDWSGNTRRQAFAYLRMFFNWCARHDIIQANPATKADAPEPQKPERGILTPAQMKAILGASGVQMRACLCLGGFAGLRTSEILHSKIVIEDDEIHIEDGKTGGRYVAILPAFRRFWPGTHLPPSQRTFYRYINTIVEVLGWKEWPKNCLRHSYASYHLAFFEDAGRTAFQMGHTSSQMVWKNYARAVKKSQAEEWWTLTP